MAITLSERAINFISSKERTTTIIGAEEISKVFADSKAPLFSPLIEFQQQFGGYIFHAGTATIQFDLIQKQVSDSDGIERSIIKFSKSERREGSYKFICASSDLGIEFELDELGRYYEDGKPVAKSVTLFIERMALFAEMKNKGGFKQIGERTNKNEEQLIINGGFLIIPEASDDMTQWYKSEHQYMEVVLGVITIFGQEKPTEISMNPPE